MVIKLFFYIFMSLLKVIVSFIESGVATLLVDKFLFLC